MTPEEINRLRLLSTVEIFQDLSEEQLKEIASRFTVMTLEPWQPLFSDRDAMEDLYIVQSGRVFIKIGEGDEQIEPIGMGGHFIEESYLYDHPAEALITSDQPVELLHMDEIDYYQLFMDFPGIKPRLARNQESECFLY